MVQFLLGADDSQSDSSDIPVSYQDVDNKPLGNKSLYIF